MHTFLKDDILRFAFDAFDLDGSGSIDQSEVEDLVDMLNKAVSLNLDVCAILCCLFGVVIHPSSLCPPFRFVIRILNSQPISKPLLK